MRILITNLTLAGRSGTELYVRDLALGLLRRGHQPVVYSPAPGESAGELRRATIPVVNDLDRVAAVPDLIHGHHNVTTLTAMLHFPEAPAIFVCHDRLSPSDDAPLLSRIYRYVAVDENCRDRMILESGVPEALVSVVYNWVDSKRFEQRSPLPANPETALIFGRYLDPEQMETITKACQKLGMLVDRMGTVAQNESVAPERRLGNYDVVFAKARSALEAMAVGSAVILAGYNRLGPMVTRSSVEDLRRLNFGMRAITNPITRESVLQVLEKYDPGDAAQVTKWIRNEASLEKGLDQLLSIYQAAIEAHRASPGRDCRKEYVEASRALGQLEKQFARLSQMVAELQNRVMELSQTAQTAVSMPPLSIEDCKRITLRTEAVPAAAPAGSTLGIQVLLTNGSESTIRSLPPHPVHLVAVWSQNGIPLEAEGYRERLSFPLAERCEGIYAFNVPAPGVPGNYKLRITLVQEQVRWMDAIGDALYSDSEIRIV